MPRSGMRTDRCSREHHQDSSHSSSDGHAEGWNTKKTRFPTWFSVTTAWIFPRRGPYSHGVLPRMMFSARRPVAFETPLAWISLARSCR
jgi:hypothetical protein